MDRAARCRLRLVELELHCAAAEAGDLLRGLLDLRTRDQRRVLRLFPSLEKKLPAFLRRSRPGSADAGPPSTRRSLALTETRR